VEAGGDATVREFDDAPLRAAIVAAGRRLGQRGLIAAGEGNLSIRLPGNRLLVTPSGVRKDELERDDLVIVTLEVRRAEAGAAGGDARGPSGLRPTSDLAIHRAVQLARPDVLAVAHAHLPASMALTLAGETPDPTVLPETALFLPRLPVVPYGTPGSEDLAYRIAQALTEPPEPLPGAAILERHGAVAVGGSRSGAERRDDPADVAATVAALDQAVDRLELIEVLCRTWRDSLLIRAAAGRYPSAAQPGRGGAPGRTREER
jgi:L-fuculose-phosphate aldolase